MKRLESECEELRNLNSIEDNRYQDVLKAVEESHTDLNSKIAQNNDLQKQIIVIVKQHYSLDILLRNKKQILQKKKCISSKSKIHLVIIKNFKVILKVILEISLRRKNILIMNSK